MMNLTNKTKIKNHHGVDRIMFLIILKFLPFFYNFKFLVNKTSILLIHHKHTQNRRKESFN